MSKCLAEVSLWPTAYRLPRQAHDVNTTSPSTSMQRHDVASSCKYNVASTSMQRHDVASTLRRRYIYVMCPLGRERIAHSQARLTSCCMLRITNFTWRGSYSRRSLGENSGSSLLLKVTGSGNFNIQFWLSLSRLRYLEYRLSRREILVPVLTRKSNGR